MGKYGIGARVRDLDGDEGVIVDKRKVSGERLVKYDGCVLWQHKADLTAVEESVEQPTPKFKVGDRVRIASTTYEFKRRHIGSEFTIKTDEGELYNEQSWSGDNGTSWRWLESELELVRRPSASDLFPIGTKVVLTGTVRGLNPLDKTNVHVVVDGLPPGRNSLGVSPSALKAA